MVDDNYAILAQQANGIALIDDAINLAFITSISFS
jgi:hypothetical protein